jgi:transposase
MVVAAAGGGSSSGVAVGMGISRLTVMRWRDRLVRDGCGGLVDEPRPGRPRVVGDELSAVTYFPRFEGLSVT